ncbi:SRPBCC family protein [Archangium lipolyticum]|uniref:SRPBCC family protein n=1 Tax=Archangium lipolyticum TaxID=2970465 RepID=UPI00214A0B2D|nr:SRPBCC family protein [Archangium lipolyticum]
MIYSTATVPVNPEGELPLTRDQLWRGLVLKARDARLFLPPGACTKCDVVVDGEEYIIREATIMGDDVSEIITFEPRTKVSFHQNKGPREGVIVNEVLEGDDGSLHLRFYCLLGLRNAEPGGEQERKEQATMDSEERGYKRALLSTLARTRLLAQEGRL